MALPIHPSTPPRERLAALQRQERLARADVDYHGRQDARESVRGRRTSAEWHRRARERARESAESLAAKVRELEQQIAAEAVEAS